MTSREREIYSVLEELNGAHPARIAERMGISTDYAEQLCRDMTWYGWFLKDGLKYKLNPRKKSELSPKKQEPQEAQEI